MVHLITTVATEGTYWWALQTTFQSIVSQSILCCASNEASSIALWVTGQWLAYCVLVYSNTGECIKAVCQANRSAICSRHCFCLYWWEGPWLLNPRLADLAVYSASHFSMLLKLWHLDWNHDLSIFRSETLPYIDCMLYTTACYH